MEPARQLWGRIPQRIVGGGPGQVRHRLEPRGIRPEDLDPDAGPVLVHTDVPDERYVDAVSDAGLAALGLPNTYPRDERGKPVSHAK